MLASKPLSWTILTAAQGPEQSRDFQGVQEAPAWPQCYSFSQEKPQGLGWGAPNREKHTRCEMGKSPTPNPTPWVCSELLVWSEVQRHQNRSQKLHLPRKGTGDRQTGERAQQCKGSLLSSFCPMCEMPRELTRVPSPLGQDSLAKGHLG